MQTYQVMWGQWSTPKHGRSPTTTYCNHHFQCVRFGDAWSLGSIIHREAIYVQGHIRTSTKQRHQSPSPEIDLDKQNRHKSISLCHLRDLEKDFLIQRFLAGKLCYAEVWNVLKLRQEVLKYVDISFVVRTSQVNALQTGMYAHSLRTLRPCAGSRYVWLSWDE